MLGGKDHCGDPGGPSVLIGHADLSFAVRQQPGHPAGAPHVIQPLYQRPCQGDRQGHQLRGLPAGVAGHDPLIPGAGILRRAVADTLSDIRRLWMKENLNVTVIRVQPQSGAVIADVPQYLPGHNLVIRFLPGADLSEQKQVVFPYGRLAGNSCLRVLRQQGIQHPIGHLITQLIRVTSGHSFRCQNVPHIAPLLPQSVQCALFLHAESVTCFLRRHYGHICRLCLMVWENALQKFRQNCLRA